MREIVHLQASQCSNQIITKFWGALTIATATCSWTWSWAPGTVCARDPLGKSSGQTTSSYMSNSTRTPQPRRRASLRRRQRKSWPRAARQ
uniref:Uncharacterized protein n=1 Tax=Ursus maritimus TaxID=29073 RepID=A0A452U554_URSMA